MIVECLGCERKFSFRHRTQRIYIKSYELNNIKLQFEIWTDGFLNPEIVGFYIDIGDGYYSFLMIDGFYFCPYCDCIFISDPSHHQKINFIDAILNDKHLNISKRLEHVKAISCLLSRFKIIFPKSEGCDDKF